MACSLFHVHVEILAAPYKSIPSTQVQPESLQCILLPTNTGMVTGQVSSTTPPPRPLVPEEEISIGLEGRDLIRAPRNKHTETEQKAEKPEGVRVENSRGLMKQT